MTKPVTQTTNGGRSNTAKKPASGKPDLHSSMPLTTSWTVAETRRFAGTDWDILIRDRNQHPVASVGVAGWDKKSSKRHAQTIVDAVNAIYGAKT